MRARNLETGNIIKCGPKFLFQQSKPYIGAKGKIFPNGVWVEVEETPISDEAAKLIADAANLVEPVTPTVPAETTGEAIAGVDDIETIYTAQTNESGQNDLS